ncbi:MAG: hypothetical protein K1X78_12570 [Verrucomicrobiaceae bacterium]|nr:hypothetical protein [Verrucomicrobiaceae bacterium]
MTSLRRILSPRVQVGVLLVIGLLCFVSEWIGVDAATRFVPIDLVFDSRTCHQSEVLLLLLGWGSLFVLALHMLLHTLLWRMDAPWLNWKSPWVTSLLVVFFFAPTTVHVYLTGRAFAHFAIAGKLEVENGDKQTRDETGPQAPPFNEIAKRVGVELLIYPKLKTGMTEPCVWVNDHRDEMKMDGARVTTPVGLLEPQRLALTALALIFSTLVVFGKLYAPSIDWNKFRPLLHREAKASFALVCFVVAVVLALQTGESPDLDEWLTRVVVFALPLFGARMLILRALAWVREGASHRERENLVPANPNQFLIDALRRRARRSHLISWAAFAAIVVGVATGVQLFLLGSYRESLIDQRVGELTIQVAEQSLAVEKATADYEAVRQPDPDPDRAQLIAQKKDILDRAESKLNKTKDDLLSLRPEPNSDHSKVWFENPSFQRLVNFFVLRIGILLMLAFLLRVLVQIFRYALRLAACYDSCADALTLGAGLDIGNLKGEAALQALEILRPFSVPPETTLDAAAPDLPQDIIKQLLETINKLTDKVPGEKG